MIFFVMIFFQMIFTLNAFSQMGKIEIIPDTTINLVKEIPDSSAVEEENNPESDVESDDAVTGEAISDPTLIIEPEPESNEDSTKWTLDAGNLLKTQQLQHGLKNSNGRPVDNLAVGISHENGFSVEFDGTKDFGTNAFLCNWSLYLGYSKFLNSWFGIGVSLNHSDFGNDTTNIFSQANNDVSLSIDFMIKKMIIDLSYQLKFGDDKFHYLGLSIFRTFKFGEKFKILPLFNLEYSYYILDIKDAYSALSKAKLQKLLKNGSANNKKSLQVKQKGIDNISLSIKFDFILGKGFDIYLKPLVSYPPMDLTLRKRIQFVGIIGVNYSLYF